MASISEKRNKDGDLTGWKVLVCTGRNERYQQQWRSSTIKLDDPRIATLTPAKRRKELEAIAHEMEHQWKAEFRENPNAATGR